MANSATGESAEMLEEARKLGREARPRREAAQRELLLRAMAGAAAEMGYEASRVEDVLELSRLSRSTFYRHFSDKEECFLAAFDSAVELMIERVRGAAAARVSAASRTQEGLRALLDLLVAEPAVARLATIEVRTAGERGQKHYEEALERFARLLEKIGDAAGTDAAIGIVMPRMIAGAVATTISLEVGAGRTTELGQLLPELVFTVLAPSVGAEGALAAMRSAAAPA